MHFQKRELLSGSPRHTESRSRKITLGAYILLSFIKTNQLFKTIFLFMKWLNIGLIVVYINKVSYD